MYQLKAFDDAFETIYGDNEINFIKIREISEEFQTNCVRLINIAKTRKNSSKYLNVTCHYMVKYFIYLFYLILMLFRYFILLFDYLKYKILCTNH